MKKILIGVMLVVLMFVCAPTPASAVTIAELQAMIASLTAQLNVLLTQQTPVPPTQIINPTSTSTGLVSFVERPTFKIAYDKNKNESRLEGSATTYIQAGENDILLNNIYLLYKDQNGRNINTNDAGRYFYVTSGANLETIQDSNNTTLSVWRIKAGTKATIAVTATENPQMMFAGSYTLSFGDVATIDPITKNYQYGRLAYQDSKSLPVTIIGEKSPYISSSAFKGSNEVTISGVRFAKGDKVYVNNVRKGVLTDVGYSTGGAAMVGAFPISWLDKSEKGGCALYGSIQIEDPKYGKSNSIYASRGCVDDNKTQININWTNGVGKLRIGLIDDRYEKNGVVLGWISGEDNSSYGMTGWDGKYVSDLNFKTTWDVSSLSKGPYRILAVTQDSNGNICSSEKTGCNFVLSDKFKITNSILNITLPPFKSTNLTPTITITSPNGGGYYAKNSPMKVTWTTNIPQTEYLDVIRLRAYPNGQEYYLAGGVSNTGGTNVTIPSNVPAGVYTLEIKTYTKGSGVLVMDASDSYFKITDSSITPPIISPTKPTVIYPNGGEILTLAKDSILVNFKPVIGVNHNINLVDSSGHAYDLARGITGQSTDIQSIGIDTSIIKNYGLGNGKYKIEICGQLGCDLSDNYFRITSGTPVTPPSITVLSPNGGENLSIGSTYTIQWNSSGLASSKNVQIGIIDTRYDTEGGERAEKIIAYSIPNTGSYSWTIPEKIDSMGLNITNDSVYKIIIHSWLDLETGVAIGDTSNNAFRISTPVVILPATATTTTGIKTCYVGHSVLGSVRWEVKSCTSRDYLNAPTDLKKEVVGTSQAEQLSSIAASIQAIKELLKSL